MNQQNQDNGAPMSELENNVYAINGAEEAYGSAGVVNVDSYVK
jgi:hypothetical protein